MIELQRTLEALERQRAAFDDIRRRLDELEARLAERAPGRGAEPRWRRRRRREVRASGSAMTASSSARPTAVSCCARGCACRPFYAGELADAGTGRPRRSQPIVRLRARPRRGHPGGARRHARVRVPPAVRRRRVAARSKTLSCSGGCAQRGRARRAVQGPLRPAAPDLERRARVRRPLGGDEVVFARSATSACAVVGRPLAGRLHYDLAVTQRRRAPGRPNDNLDLGVLGAHRGGAVRPAAAGGGRHRMAHAPAGVGRRDAATTTWRPPTSGCARASDREHRRRRQRPDRQRRDLAGRGRAARAVARAPRCRPSGSGAARTRRRRGVAQVLGRVRAGELLHAPSSGCRSRAGSAARTSAALRRRQRRTASPRHARRRAERRPSAPTCAATGPSCRSTTAT